jgi:nicotinamidase/pyrazinamidase
MRALILVDIQNDFIPGGALAVPEGDRIVPLASALQQKFQIIVATQDWHPRDHGSFAANHPGRKPGDVIELNGLPQVLWPVHCVQETSGAAFVPVLDVSRITQVFRKGTDPAIDSYSGFFDNGHRKSTGMGDWLKARGVSDLFVCGLATDYCVKFTALDGRGLGFNVSLVEDACRGVNLKPDDSAHAIDAMKDAGVRIIRAAEVKNDDWTCHRRCMTTAITRDPVPSPPSTVARGPIAFPPAPRPLRSPA